MFCKQFALFIRNRGSVLGLSWPQTKISTLPNLPVKDHHPWLDKESLFLKSVSVAITDCAICLIGILGRAQKYFTYTTVANIMLGWNRTVPLRSPFPSAGCWKTFVSTAAEVANMSRAWTHNDGIDEIGLLRSYCAAVTHWTTEASSLYLQVIDCKNRWKKWRAIVECSFGRYRPMCILFKSSEIFMKSASAA